MKYLICGSKGQLAQQFVKELEQRSEDVKAPPEYDLDLTDADRVNAACQAYQPDVILNCAAYNYVDKAESEPKAAFMVNAEGVQNLALAARRFKAHLVHFSSDYVFDGTKEGLYCETDAAHPLNVYGHSKLQGEKLLQQSGLEQYTIFRTSWVFGSGSQNFLYKLRQWSAGGDVVKMVCDQISVPTYTADMVPVVLKAIEQKVYGLYHLTNSGYATRYEVARHFLHCLGRPNLVLPVSSALFKTAAQRPYFSVLDSSRISQELSITIAPWQAAIERFCQDEGLR